MYSSSKIYDGFSCTFRQWKAEGTHCKYLHGYGISFKVTFQGNLDAKNWVFDFGGMKRAKETIDGRNPKDWMEFMFDHTTIIAQDDPELETFKELDAKNLIQLRIIPGTGAERFAEFLFQNLNAFVQKETEGRVFVSSVQFMEHGKNSATYSI